MAKTASIAKKSPARKTNAKKSNAKKPAAKKSNKAKTASKKSACSDKAAGDEVITIDRRRQQRRAEQQAAAEESNKVEDQTAESSVAAKPERRKKVQRRRQIDPTTCERDYSEAEVEFMNAMDEYKRTSGRMFPTCSEVLEVLRTMGYEKLTPAEFELLGRTPVGETDSEESEALEEAEEMAAC